jgi:hypothetical protein
MLTNAQRIAVVLCALGLASCGVTAKVDVREQYQKSLADYRSCLAGNEANASVCDGKRLIVDADERAVAQLSAGWVEYSSSPTDNITQAR